MRKYNKVKRLNRTKEHREAMLRNMASDLFYHERITSTTAKAKVVRQLAERLITRARLNLVDGVTLEKKVHNIRLVGKFIKSKEVLNKLFDDIAPRFKERLGGYTRVIKLGARNSDKSEMAFVELLERKKLVVLKDERKKKRSEMKEKKKPSEKSSDLKSSEDKSSSKTIV